MWPFPSWRVYADLIIRDWGGGEIFLLSVLVQLSTCHTQATLNFSWVKTVDELKTNPAPLGFLDESPVIRNRVSSKLKKIFCFLIHFYFDKSC